MPEAEAVVIPEDDAVVVIPGAGEVVMPEDERRRGRELEAECLCHVEAQGVAVQRAQAGALGACA